MNREPGVERGAEPAPRISRFERRVWAAQRWAWASVTGGLLLALTGGLGAGPLSSATVGSADGTLEVQYERVMRANQQATMEWRIRPDSGMAAAIELTPAFRALLSVSEFAPLPEGAEVIDSVERVRFRARSTHRVPVRLTVEARRFGHHSLRTRAAGGEWVTLDLWILP
jgi:protein-L-isoaspartate(D-aspartate) O-methyltransferase